MNAIISRAYAPFVHVHIIQKAVYPEVGTEVLCEIPSGTECEVLGRDYSYCKVKVLGMEGYCHYKFVHTLSEDNDGRYIQRNVHANKKKGRRL